MSKIPVVAVVLTLFLASCSSPEPDMTALKKTVDEFNAASKEAMTMGSSDKVIAYYEDDAFEMAPNMALIKGKAAIKEFQDQMSKSGMKITAATFETLDLQAGGTIAYEIGTYDMTVSMSKMGEMKDKGKFVTLWHQQKDGSWKVRAETWNSDMPATSVDQSKSKQTDAKKKMTSKKADTKKSAVSKKTDAKKKSASKKAVTKKSAKKKK